jgi:hypothetical protein
MRDETQGKLDAAQSDLAMMRGKVATSELSIDYRSSGAFASGGVWAPMAKATHLFVRDMIAAAAGVVYLLAWLLPWAVVIGLAAWAAHLIIGWRRSAPSR